MFSTSRSVRRAPALSDANFENVVMLLNDTGTNGAQNNTFVADPIVAPAGVGYLAGLFDGNADYLSLSNNTAFLFGSGDFTVECWYYATVLSTTQTLIGIWDDVSTTPQSWLLYTDSSNKWKFTVDVATIDTQVLTSSASVTANSWNHIAITRSGNTWRMFINGALDVSATNSSTISNGTGPLCISGFSGSSAANKYSFNGYISNVRIVKGTAVYTSNFSVPTAPLTAVSGTSLLTCQSGSGSTFADNSSNNFTVTVTGTPTMTGVATTPPGAVPYAAYFDGNGDYATANSATAFAIGSGDFTIESWFYLTAYSPSYSGGYAAAICSNKTGGSALSGFELIVSGTATSYTGVSVLARNSGTTAVSFNGSATINLFTWYHVAWVRNGNIFTIYLNGVAIGTTTTANTWTNLNDLNIGAAAITGYQYYLPGYMSNFRLVKGTAVYTSNFVPPTQPLTAISGTTVLTLQNSSLVDNSTSALTITVVGNTTVTSSYILPAITRNGTPTQGSFSPYGDLWSNYFDVTNTCLVVNGTTSVGNIPTGTDFTIEFWLRSKSINAGGGVVVGKSRFDSQSSDSWFMESNKGTGSNKLTFTGHNGTNIFTPVTSTSSVLDGKWHHCAVTRSGTTYRMFIDGVLEQQADNSTVINQGTTNITFCGIAFNTSNFAHLGNISNLRIVKGTCLYTSTFVPSTTPLTAVTNTLLLTAQNNRFKDNSSNNFSVTVSNGTPSVQRFSPFNPTTSYSATSIGGSGYFGGSGNYLSLDDSDRYLIAGDFTIEGWVYPTSASDFTSIFSQWGIPSSAVHFGLTATNLRPYIAYNISGGVGVTGTTTQGILNQWNHVAVTRSGSTIRLFVNGVQDSTTGTASGSFVNSTFGPNIGRINGTDGGSITGYLADVRFVNGSAMYTANFTPPTAPLIATPNTSLMLEFTNAGIFDSTGINSITTVGDARANTAQSKWGSTSLYFDGSGDYLSTPTSPNMNFGTGDFTVEAWVYPTSLSSDWFISSASGSGGFFFGFSSTTIVGYGWGRAGIAWDYRVASTATANTWQHVAVTRSGTSMRLFVNGVQQGTTQTISTAYNMGTTSTTIGSQGANYYLTGYIDDLRITTGIARYTADFTAPTRSFLTR